MTRGVSEPLDLSTSVERFVESGLRVLREYGPAELTVRRVAEVASASTMGIYTRFGGRAGMLEAIYRRGMELLHAGALDSTFALLVGETARAQRDGLLAGDDAVRPSYLVWTMIHGLTSLELTHAARSPVPNWPLDTPEAGERALVDAVRALINGWR